MYLLVKLSSPCLLLPRPPRYFPSAVAPCPVYSGEPRGTCPCCCLYWLLTHSAMLVCPDPTVDHTIALPLPGSGRSDAPAPSPPQSRGGSGRSGCKSSRSLEPSSLGDMPGCDPGKASGLPVPLAFEPRRPSSSSRSSSCCTPSSSPGAGLHHPPVYREGMVFNPTTGGPSAGQAGQRKIGL